MYRSPEYDGLNWSLASAPLPSLPISLVATSSDDAEARNCQASNRHQKAPEHTLTPLLRMLPGSRFRPSVLLLLSPPPIRLVHLPSKFEQHIIELPRLGRANLHTDEVGQHVT